MHRNFKHFRSVRARWTPTSSQPLTLEWDVNHCSVQDTLLKLRDRYAVSFEDRNLGYALSVFIQKTELESYILHKISFRMTEDENNGDDTVSLDIPNVDRLAEHFVSLEGNLADKCYVWVKWQLESDASLANHHIDDEVLWTIAKSMQRVIFPYYVRRYITLLQTQRYPYYPYYGQIFMDAYENAASCVPASAEEYASSSLPVCAKEKFYLVNMANPDKQREKIRFRKLCGASFFV